MPSKPRKPAEPVHGACGLFLRITTGKRTQLYRLVSLNTDPRVANPAWRLWKDAETFYDVHLGPHGPECTCADATYRQRNNTPAPCKHAGAIRAVGLLRQLRVVRKDPGE